MKCREFVDFLMAYLDESLESRERSVFEQHMEDCPGCETYLGTYAETIKAGQLACEREEVPADVPDELIAAILAARDAS